MDTSEIGFWLMIAFWGSAIGSIAFGISWARRKGRSPVSDEQILISLKKRLEK
jgi:putative membrane protein